MPLLSLKDIGKIYVSDGNVSVGIRGVNLDFDKGEFVAVTGKSGSGKSTLLNVISGMDSYEEGEMYVDGEVTSHYLQPDWEEYREKYISFIFQDYNIIESFTVLQNVELALMHIEDKKERRQRAVELLKRVGLSSQLHQKGSRLSGGQKQRTVIARALAKDSPIILADEPTGNLDSVTSKEIIDLLYEVSRDKLLIMVTHNFDQIEHYATRHVRIFDGAVEFDHSLTEKRCEDTKVHEAKRSGVDNKIKNGITLGKTIFKAKPKLSVFLCLLMLIGTLGTFFVTSVCGSASELFEDAYMFEQIEGRLVLAKRNGGVPTEEEIKALAEEYGAKSYLRCDILLDLGDSRMVKTPHLDDYKFFGVNFKYGKDYGDDITGRYPEKENEAFLYLPISYKPIFGEGTLKQDDLNFCGLDYTVTGVKYYFDNRKSLECLLTEEGFKTATSVIFISDSFPTMTLSTVSASGIENVHSFSSQIIPSFDIEPGKVYINEQTLMKDMESATLTINAQYNTYDYDTDSSHEYVFSKSFTEKDFTNTPPSNAETEYSEVYMSCDIINEMAGETISNSYRQFSLFFGNNEEAKAAAEKLNAREYVAVTSDTTYERDASETIVTVILGIVLILVWFLVIVFLAFFINLCSHRTLSAFKGDMAIMRSMGIPVNVIRIGMYVRMFLALIPGYVMTVIVGILVFTTPKFNEHFVYLDPWLYGVIFLGMLIITARITHKQIKDLFGESVKKSLKGGRSE